MTDAARIAALERLCASAIGRIGYLEKQIEELTAVIHALRDQLQGVNGTGLIE